MDELLSLISRCPGPIWEHYRAVHRDLHDHNPGIDIQAAVERAWALTLEWQQAQKEPPGGPADGPDRNPGSQTALWAEDRYGVR